MFIPHSGRQGYEAATPAVFNSGFADANIEIPHHSVWHVEAMSNVRDVENFLDSLENQNEISKQELIVLGNASFIVRWEIDSPNRESTLSPDHAATHRHVIACGPIR